jgi:hypothetical protein
MVTPLAGSPHAPPFTSSVTTDQHTHPQNAPRRPGTPRCIQLIIETSRRHAFWRSWANGKTEPGRDVEAEPAALKR